MNDELSPLPDFRPIVCKACTFPEPPRPPEQYAPNTRYCSNCREVLSTLCRICENDTPNLAAALCNPCKSSARHLSMILKSPKKKIIVARFNYVARNYTNEVWER